jgi:hypothetical protein
MDTVGGLVP